MISTIGRQDVMLVASSIKKNLTEQQIGQVLSMYNHEEESVSKVIERIHLFLILIIYGHE